MEFELRALELHGRHIWRRDSVLRALDFIRRHGLNALVLHETDLVQMVTYPRAYLDPYGLWRSAPTRRGENAIENNRAYLGHVLHLASEAGVQVFAETKEIGFPDEILELHPELLKDGTVCPSEPFWKEFIARKTEEFFGDFPLLAGMISSAGSTEGRASRAQGKCRCDLCRDTKLEDWYAGIIAALHDAARRHGKLLAVRDFAYKPEDHRPLIAAIDRAPPEVVFCGKVTPHDFYLTFPPNPALGRPGRRQWIEYDAMGQFNGWGVFPALMLDDAAHRLAHAAGRGASGVLLRVEWERINDHWSLDGPEAVNAVAAAAVARGEAPDAAAACRTWLAAAGHAPTGAAWLADVLTRAGAALRGALYADDFVFADNSMYPRSLARAFWGMEVRDALHTWDPSRAGGLVMNRARIAALLAEKAAALAAAQAVADTVRAGDPGLSAALHAELRQRFDLFPVYVEGFLRAAEVVFRARWCDPAGRDDDGPDAADLDVFRAALDRLDGFAARIRPLTASTALPHQAIMLMDHRRIADILREGRAALAGAEARQ